MGITKPQKHSNTRFTRENPMTIILDGYTKKDARRFAWEIKTLARYMAQIRDLAKIEGPENVGLTSQNVEILIDKDSNTILINPVNFASHNKAEILAEIIAALTVQYQYDNGLLSLVINGLFNKTFRQ